MSTLTTLLWLCTARSVLTSKPYFVTHQDKAIAMAQAMEKCQAKHRRCYKAGCKEVNPVNEEDNSYEEDT